MRHGGPLAVGLVVVLCRPASAAADRQIRPLIGFTFAGSTTFLDLAHAVGKRHAVIGVDGVVLGNIFGVEVDLGRMPGFFQTTVPFGQSPVVLSSSVTTLTGSLVIAAPRKLTEYTLRPYFVAGAGGMRITQDHPLEVLPVRDTVGVYNLGGGVVGFLTNRVGVAWDVRRFSSVKGSATQGQSTGGRLAFWRASMALAIRY
jgi:hypothetical protein